MDHWDMLVDENQRLKDEINSGKASRRVRLRLAIMTNGQRPADADEVIATVEKLALYLEGNDQ